MADKKDSGTSAFVAARGTEHAWFARAYGPMVFDDRLGDGELRLLLAILLRCCGKGECFVGVKTLAVDLGISDRTVLARIARLRELEWISDESRGFGRTTRKVVADPEVMYGRDLLLAIPKLLKSGRSDEEVDQLRSRGAESCTTGGAESFTPQCAESCTTEVEKVEVEEVGKDLPAPQDPSDKTPGENEGKAAAERWGSVESAAAAAQARNRKAVEERMKKKSRRRAGKRADSKKDRITVVDVEGWFKDEIASRWTLAQSKWTLKEKANAKLLLDSYGPELVEKTIRYVVRNWEDVSARMNIGAAVPSIGMLTGYRDSIFGEVQVGVNRKKTDIRSGEYDPDAAKRSPSAGWGDLAKRSGDS